MSVVRFNYIPYKLKDASGKEKGIVYRPIIPIRLGYNHSVSKFSIDCLVDSGADTNLFPAQWGALMGIKIKTGNPHPVYGIGSININAYRHRIDIYVGTSKLFVEADFSDQQTVPLLGRDGFFNCFKKVIFNDQDKYIELEE